MEACVYTHAVFSCQRALGVFRREIQAERETARSRSCCFTFANLSTWSLFPSGLQKTSPITPTYKAENVFRFLQSIFLFALCTRCRRFRAHIKIVIQLPYECCIPRRKTGTSTYTCAIYVCTHVKRDNEPRNMYLFIYTAAAAENCVYNAVWCSYNVRWFRFCTSSMFPGLSNVTRQRFRSFFFECVFSSSFTLLFGNSLEFKPLFLVQKKKIIIIIAMIETPPLRSASKINIEVFFIHSFFLLA